MFNSSSDPYAVTPHDSDLQNIDAADASTSKASRNSINKYLSAPPPDSVELRKQSERLLSLERICNDLELRLEEQTRQTFAAEKRSSDLESHWQEKNNILIREAEEMKEKYIQQLKKNEK